MWIASLHRVFSSQVCSAGRRKRIEELTLAVAHRHRRELHPGRVGIPLELEDHSQGTAAVAARRSIRLQSLAVVAVVGIAVNNPGRSLAVVARRGRSLDWAQAIRIDSDTAAAAVAAAAVGSLGCRSRRDQTL